MFSLYLTAFMFFSLTFAELPLKLNTGLFPLLSVKLSHNSLLFRFKLHCSTFLPNTLAFFPFAQPKFKCAMRVLTLHKYTVGEIHHHRIDLSAVNSIAIWSFAHAFTFGMNIFGQSDAVFLDALLFSWYLVNVKNPLNKRELRLTGIYLPG